MKMDRLGIDLLENSWRRMKVKGTQIKEGTLVDFCWKIRGKEGQVCVGLYSLCWFKDDEFSKSGIKVP